MVLCIICVSLIMGLIVLTEKNAHRRCSFDGYRVMGPTDLPIVVWIGAGVYATSLILFICLFVSLGRYRFESYYPFLVGPGHIGAIAAEIGLIYYVEINVRFAQHFLVGGSEDDWGFGQIFAIASLVIPVVEMTEHVLSPSMDDPKRSRLVHWLRIHIYHSGKKLWNGRYPFKWLS